MAGYKHGETLKTPKGFLDHTKYQIRHLQEVEQRLNDRIEYLTRLEEVKRSRLKSLPPEWAPRPDRPQQEIIDEANEILAKIQEEHPQPPGIGAKRMALFLREQSLCTRRRGRKQRGPSVQDIIDHEPKVKVEAGESYSIAA